MSEHIGVSQLSYAVLSSTDLEHWLKFAEIIGAEVTRSGGTTLLRLEQERSYRIILEEGATDDLRAIGWDAPSKEAFDILVQRLDKAGAKPLAVPELCVPRGVEELVTFQDPDGRLCELSWDPLPRNHRGQPVLGVGPHAFHR